MITEEHLFKIAMIIDNDFIGCEETFTCEKHDRYYVLTTNKCDWSSIIRVYYECDEIVKITRNGYDTESFQEIHESTYEKIKQLDKRCLTCNHYSMKVCDVCGVTSDNYVCSGWVQKE